MTLRELKTLLNDIKEDELDNQLILEIFYDGLRSKGYVKSKKNIEFDGFDTIYGEMTDGDDTGSY